MAATNGTGDRASLLAWGLLSIVGIFLGARSWQVASAVLGAQARAPEVVAAQGADSTLVAPASTVVSPCKRNPFAEPSGLSVAPSETAAHPEPRPVARFLLVDRSDRVVQIAVGDSLSPRLREGEAFLGWRVVAIHPSSVTVSKAGKSVVLSSP